MALTPSTVHFDKKCGASNIADNKKCRKGSVGAALGRQRDAQRMLERRYGKPKPLTKQQKLTALGVTALATGAGVGLGVIAKKRQKANSNKPPNINNVKVPNPGKVNFKGSGADLEKTAAKGRLNELESLARGTNPALEAQMQVNKARNQQARQELGDMRSELQRLRTEIGVWGPNRIKPFKRNKRDSIWAEGFEP